LQQFLSKDAMNFSVVGSQFFPLLINGLALGFIYVLVSVGYTMVYGVLRLINFANSEIFMLGTFATAIVSTSVFEFNQNSQPSHGMKLFIVLLCCLLASMATSGVVAVFVELIAYRRLRTKGANRLGSLISAIGTSITLSEGVRILTHSIPVASPRVLSKFYIFKIHGVGLRIDQLLTIASGLLLFIAVDRFVTKTRMGKAIRAVSMSEENSKLMGINLNRVISLTFLIGGLVTGAAAFMYMTVYEQTVFNVGFNIGLAAFTAAVLGGIGNLRGAFYGGLALGLAEEYFSALLGSQWKEITVFVVLVLVLLVKPNGLFGEAVQQTRV
jgi:branched-chain amino acid transport system permease protein